MDVPERLVGGALIGWASRPRGVGIPIVVCWSQTSRLPSTSAATPAAAGRGKGGPQAHPAGTRSALPATEAAGILMRAGSGRGWP